MQRNEDSFKVKIVELILQKETIKALEALSEHYRVDTPHLKVGMPKKIGKKAGCYVPNTKTVYVASQERLADPFVIIHEFYHHLRYQGGKHRGTEKLADKFAEEFIVAFKNAHSYNFYVSYKYQNPET
jgi:hypothetical protein